MATLFGHIWRKLLGYNQSGIVEMLGVAPLGAAGALAAAYVAGTDTPMFTVTKTAGEAGRYTIQCVDTRGNAVAVLKFFFRHCNIEGAADAVYTTDKGLTAFVRNVNAAAGSFDIQLTYLDDASGAWVDANPEDSTKLHIGFAVKLSSARI
jgi:hypothetical protein